MATKAELVHEAHEQLERQVAALSDGEQWQQYLNTVARLPRYSANNQLLIHSQRPDATLVAGLRKWNQMGRRVRKGERGLSIFAPLRYREQAVEGSTTDPPESADRSREVIRGFRIAKVFDLSQTDGAPLAEPPRPHLLEGGVPEGLWDSLTEYGERDGWVVAVENLSPSRGSQPNGYTDHANRRIVVGSHCEPLQAAKTLVHEIAHKELHEAISPADRHAGVHEVEAESVAYVVMRGAGLDSSSYSPAYVLGWSGGDADVIRRTAQRVRDVAGDVLTDVYERVPELDPSTAVHEAIDRQERRSQRALSA